MDKKWLKSVWPKSRKKTDGIFVNPDDRIKINDVYFRYLKSDKLYLTFNMNHYLNLTIEGKLEKENLK